MTRRKVYIDAGMVDMGLISLESMGERKQSTTTTAFDDPTFKRYMLGSWWD